MKLSEEEIGILSAALDHWMDYLDESEQEDAYRDAGLLYEHLTGVNVLDEGPEAA